MNAPIDDQPRRTLSDGNSIPMLGLGVWQVANDQECVDAVKWALEAGYRHIDTAQAYGNEEAVGRGLKEAGLPRDQIFVTTKFYPGHKDPAAEVEKSLDRLGLDYVDLYIIHWPQGGPLWAWPGMEQAHSAGHARSIGVSNFSVDDLAQVRGIATVAPVVNQVQFNPFAYRKRLLEACEQDGIALEAYSPLGTGNHLNDQAVVSIAERLHRTPAQVLVRWCVQIGVPVIPKSTHRERIVENGRVFDFALTDDDMQQLSALDQTGGTGRALEHPWWS